MSLDYILRFDGASRNNPGHSAYGFVLYSVNKIDNSLEKIYSEGHYIGKATNNQAEYRALLEGVKYCRKQNLKNIRFEGDSELVINQIRGVWLVKDDVLKTYYFDIVKELPNFEYIELRHIERKYNKDADKICNEILNTFLKTTKTK